MYPHILSRDDELKFIQNNYIEKAMGLLNATIVITNSYKKYWFTSEIADIDDNVVKIGEDAAQIAAFFYYINKPLIQ